MSSLSITHVLLLIIFVLVCTPYFKTFRTRSIDIFEPIYWASAYFLLIFVLRSVYLLDFGGYSHFLGESPYPSETIADWNTSLLYLLLSLFIFLVSYYSRIGVSIAHSLPGLPAEFDERKIKIFIPIALAISLACHFIILHKFGGFHYYLTQKVRILHSDGLIYLILGTSFTPIAFSIGSVICLRYLQLQKTTFLLLLPAVILNGFFMGSKGALLSPLLSFLIIFHYIKKPLQLRYILLFTVFAVCLFPIFEIIRNLHDLPYYLESFREKHYSQITLFYFMDRFHDMDSMVSIIRDTPEIMDYQLGKTITPILVSWIPRMLWNEKPIISFGKIFSETYFKSTMGMSGISSSPTIIGESYINFHIAGVLWVSALAGISIRIIYTYFIRKNFGAAGLFIYSAIFLFLFTFWEQAIVGLVTYATALLILLLILAFLLKRSPARLNTLHPKSATTFEKDTKA